MYSRIERMRRDARVRLRRHLLALVIMRQVVPDQLLQLLRVPEGQHAVAKHIRQFRPLRETDCAGDTRTDRRHVPADRFP